MNHITEPQKKEITADEFLKSIAVKTKDVDIEGLGVVTIQPLTLSTRSNVAKACTKRDDKGNETMDKFDFQAMTVLQCLVKPKLELKNLVDIRNANISVIDKLSKEIFKLSGIDVETEDARKNG